MPRKRARIDLAEAMALYADEAVPFKEKARKLGVSPDTLRRFLRENGVDVPRRSGTASSRLSAGEVERLYVEQNLSRADVAKKLGVSEATLGRFLSDNGIEKDRSKSAELREQTMLERHGARHALECPEFREKARATCRENHGVDYPMQSPEIQKKANREKAKSGRPVQAGAASRNRADGTSDGAHRRYSELCDEEKAEMQAERSRRRRRTNMERYGVENPSQVPAFRQKARETTAGHYGDAEFFRTDAFRERAAKTSRERYGTDHPMQSDEVKERMLRTVRDRYGGNSSQSSGEVREKGIETSRRRYGTDNPMQSEEVRRRQRDTMVERYGEDNPSKVLEFQDKKKATNLRRYGADNHAKRSIAHLDEWDDRAGFAGVCIRMHDELGRKPHVAEIMEYFGVGPSAAYAHVSAYGCRGLVETGSSHIEDRWRSWLKSEGVECSDRPERLLKPESGKPLEIDIYVPGCSLGLEIDPTYTHNSTASPFDGTQPKSPSYHQEKARLAEQAGINLVHVYDFDDEDKMRSLIRSLCHLNERVYARDTICEPIDRREERAFLEENHLKGYVKSERCYGLFPKGEKRELLAVMSFGEPRYGTGDEKGIRWEMLRFCSKSGLTVVGGASKLFSAFVRECSPESVLSYASYDISNGNMYEALGFEYRRTTNPSYTWVKPDDPADRYSWYVVNAKGFDNLFGTGHGRGSSNRELMEQAGYVQVFNSGSKVYIWTARS